MPLLTHEYKSLLNALRNKATSDGLGWTIIDCLRTSVGQGKFSPVTYADSYFDANGVEVPCDTVLVEPPDQMTKQALDYIFWLQPAAYETKQPLSQSRLEVAIERTQVEKFPCFGLPCKHCSDHFGISTEIRMATRNLH